MVRARSDGHRARNEQVRTMFASLAEATILPSTSTTVATRAQALNWLHSVEEIPNGKGAKIHWLGDKAAKKVLLYFHGGGFALSAMDGHPNFLKDTADRFRQSSGQALLVAFLEYSLSGVGKFPLQLSQAVEALKVVLGKGFKPNDVVIGGDSAGGNMSLGVISQALHPLEGVPHLKLEEPLAGVLLISPWISFDETTNSYKENQSTDICGPILLKEMVEGYVAPEQRNAWSEPILANSSWWNGFPAKTVLNVWGEIEMLRDAVATMGDTLTSARVNVKNIECPLHVHVDCVLDASSGLEYGNMATEIWGWLNNALSD